MRRHKSLRHAKSVQVDVAHLYVTSLIVAFLLFVVAFVGKGAETVPLTTLVKTTISKQEETPPFFDKRAFDGLVLNAKAYIVYDIVGKEIIASHNGESMLPLASITKVMTSLTALTLSKDNKDELFIIDPSVIEDGYDLGLARNQKWKLEELLKYMLIFSSNDAALTVASHYGGQGEFVKNMNTLSGIFGLSAVFTDPAGRDVDGKIGGYGTAHDVAKLFVLAKTTAPDLLDATTKKRQSVYPLSGRLTGVPNTNQEIENLPGAEGSKTGYTDLAGGNLGIVVDITIGRPVVIVVLGSSREGRFKDVDILYEALRKSLQPFPTNKGE